MESMESYPEKTSTRERKSQQWGSKFWHFNWFTPFYFGWFIFGLLVLRKTERAINSNKYVLQHRHQVSQESLENSADFHHFLTMLDDMDKPPAILLLNQFAINITHNYLCNTAAFPGVHERFVFVTLDKVAAEVMRREWPHIKQFHWPTPGLYVRFSFGQGPYQLIYLFRANLAATLIRHGRSFWMMQQDTFWRENLFQLDLESHGDYDLLLDQLADRDDSVRIGYLNGANFYVRANNKTQKYFDAVAKKLTHWYTADVAFMHHQCYKWGSNESKCDYIPLSIAHNWQWIYSNQKNPPYIMQLDCEMDAGTKLQQLALYGFNFTLADGRTCNQSAVQATRQQMISGNLDARLTQQSWGRLTFKVYYIISDTIFYFFPSVKHYIGFIAFILMITF